LVHIFVYNDILEKVIRDGVATFADKNFADKNNTDQIFVDQKFADQTIADRKFADQNKKRFFLIKNFFNKIMIFDATGRSMFKTSLDVGGSISSNRSK
jgi:hypothetical protein